MGKIEFKEFVKNNPSLYKYVKNQEMTWQKFYELFDLYGSDNEVWNDYIKVNKTVSTTTSSSFDLLNWLKKFNLDEIQDGLNSVGRVVSVLQDLGTNNDSTNAQSTYKPRPLYKHFED